MKFRQLQWFFALFVMLIVIGCGSLTKTKKTTDNALPNVVNGCEAVGMIKDFRNQSDCQFLIQLEDGRLLLPIILPSTNVPFYDGAYIKLGFEIIENNDKNVVQGVQCKAFSDLVRVTCIEEHVKPNGDLPVDYAACEPIKNPYQVSWITEIIQSLIPEQVYEYDYEIGLLYEFRKDGQSILYDCLGNLMCTTKESKDCSSLIETLGKGRIIVQNK